MPASQDRDSPRTLASVSKRRTRRRTVMVRRRGMRDGADVRPLWAIPGPRENDAVTIPPLVPRTDTGVPR